jgi:tetratricopeptide (TPR) repeat protein/predicted nucleic acid-binding protein
VHIIAQRPLGWLGALDDTPSAVSAETEGPGDDARIEYGGRLRVAELQAKHGLSGVAKMREAITKVRGRSRVGDDSPVIVAVDRLGSARALRDFARDFERLRAGRTDVIKADTVALLIALQEQQGNPEADANADANSVAGDEANQAQDPPVVAWPSEWRETDAERLLQRIYVVPADLDDPHDPERKLAIEILRDRLDDPTQVEKAWAVLAADAQDICKRRLRRGRKDLVSLLEGVGVHVRPPAKDDRWHRTLDGTKRLLQKRHAKAALASLVELELTLDTSPDAASVDPEVRFRIAQHRANALVQLNRPEDALSAIGKALDLKPRDVLALVSASGAALSAGDVKRARAFATKAIQADEPNPRAWGALALVTSACGDPLPSPPTSVAETTHYRGILAHIAAEHHQTDRVLTLTEGLLADGHRDADILFLRANALLGQATADVTADRERFSAVERLSSEIIDQLRDDFHPLTVTAYVLRASARRRLGREGDADKDVEIAHSLGSDDLNAIGHTAQLRIERNDAMGALEVLNHPVVERTPELLMLRARLHAIEGDHGAARRELDLARGMLGQASDEDRVRTMIADVNVLLGDTTGAETALAGVSAIGQQKPMYMLTRGRLAFTRRDIATGETLYRQAADLDRENRDGILSELAGLLLRAGLPSASVRAFDDASAIPSQATQIFAAALFEANELVRAQALIDELAGAGPLPDWALGLATDIARRQEDTDAAIAHLTDLVGRETQTENVRIALARMLIENKRHQDAAEHLDALLRWHPPTPRARMQVAQLLHMAGRDNEAVQLAFRAFRGAPNDADMHRAFISLTLTGKAIPRKVTTVGPDTWVRLTREKGSDREHTIFADEPIDPTRSEMSVVDADAAGLIGTVVGDVIVRHEQTWQEQRWTVAEIQPAELHAVQVAAKEFANRFPSEPFFLTSFEIGDGTSVDAFAPIIASLHERRERVNQVGRLYHEHVLPLGAIAQLLGGSIGDAMDYFASDEGGPLWVEWAASADEIAAREAATTAKEVVLTHSAIYTLFLLGLEGKIPEMSYTLLTPRTLHDELRQQVDDAQRLLVDGQHVLMSGDTGLQSHEVEPGHPSLRLNLELRQRALAWVEGETQVTVRPLATVQSSTTPTEDLREKIGRSSADALALAQHRSAVLYADDLGLRRLETANEAVLPAFSTITLLSVLSQRNIISNDERDRHFRALVLRRYMHVQPTAELLRSALRDVDKIGESGVARVFLLLSGPQLTPNTAAKLVTSAVRAELMAPVQVTTPERVFSLAVVAMRTKWPALLCMRAIARAVAEDLPLFPAAQTAFVEVAQVLLRELTQTKALGELD